MAIFRGFFLHVPQKNRNFFCRCDSNTFDRRILYKCCRFWNRSLIFFWHIVVFGQCLSVGFESLEVLENWSRSKVGQFYPWNHTERWISQPIFAGPQSPLDDFNATFWHLCKTYHLWLQQSNMRIAPGEKSIFGPIWVRKCPKNLKNFPGIHSTVASNRSKAQAQDLGRLHWKRAHDFSLTNVFFVEFRFHNMSFLAAEKIGDSSIKSDMKLGPQTHFGAESQS